MPRNTAYCQNCLGNKPNFSAAFCDDCQSAVDAARAKAATEGTDLAHARAAALAGRAWSTHSNRPDPRSPVTFASVNEAAVRERLGN